VFRQHDTLDWAIRFIIDILPGIQVGEDVGMLSLCEGGGFDGAEVKSRPLNPTIVLGNCWDVAVVWRFGRTRTRGLLMMLSDTKHSAVQFE